MDRECKNEWRRAVSAVLAESLALLSELDEYLNFDYFIPKEEA